MRLIGLQVVKTGNVCRETLGFSYVLFTSLNKLSEKHSYIISVSTLSDNREAAEKEANISVMLH